MEGEGETKDRGGVPVTSPAGAGGLQTLHSSLRLFLVNTLEYWSGAGAGRLGPTESIAVRLSSRPGEKMLVFKCRSLTQHGLRIKGETFRLDFRYI